MGTEPRLGGICTLSYPRLPPSARARWSRPQLQDRKGSGEGRARRRGKGQKEEGPGEEGGARRGRSQEGGAQHWHPHTVPTRTLVGPRSLPSRENPSLKAKFLLTLMCGTPPCLSNTLYCSRL